METPGGGRYVIFEGGVVYSGPKADAAMAFSVDLPLEATISAVDAEVEKIIKDTPLSYDGETRLNTVHKWYEHKGKRHFRVMQLSLDMVAEVERTDLRPAVGLELYFFFEVIDGHVVVTLLREQHFVVSERASDSFANWAEQMSEGLDNWREKLTSGLSEWEMRLRSGGERPRDLLKSGLEDTREMLTSGVKDTREVFASGIEGVVNKLVDRRLTRQLSDAVGKSVRIPGGSELLAAQLQEDGTLRLYFGE
jgi:hypothetical protein